MTKTAPECQMIPGEDLLDNPVAWGRRLIETQDHDPLYSGLFHWEVKGSRLRRFMLAYWCCYSVGASWWLSQHSGSRFWEALTVAAENVKPAPIGGRWPRAHERRHWRGQKCVDSVDWLRGRFKHPEEAVISLEPARTLKEVEQLMDWPQFGPWIAFKAADMLECILGVPIQFPQDIVTLYRDPRKGAEMASPLMGGLTPQGVAQAMIQQYYEAGLYAPPSGNRRINIQEVETVLCKWKSARNGRYWIGLDTRDHRAELERWGAQDLLSVYPNLPA